MPGQPLLVLTILCLGPVGPAAGAESNVALASQGAVAVADSVYGNGQNPAFAVDNANDGRWIGPGDPPDKNRCSFGDLPHPHWLWVRFRQPARISRAVVHRAHDVDYPVDFAGEYSPDGGATFRTLFVVRNNRMDAQVFAVERAFDPVVTDNFRLRIDRSSMRDHPDWAQLSELEVFGTFVEPSPKAGPPVPAPTPPAFVLKPTAAAAVEVRERADGIEFCSPWLRLAASRNRPQVTFLAWDSVGEGKVQTNLLRPGEDGGMQPTPGTPVFSSPARPRLSLVQREGNVIRYQGEFAGGIAATWELRVEGKSVATSIGWAGDGSGALRFPPAIRLAFDLGVSSVAPLANPPPGPPAPLPLPALLHGGRNGTILVRRTDGGPALLDGAGRWDALLFAPAERRADRLYRFPADPARWEFTFSVERVEPLPELVAGEPRLRLLARHWINGFQYRPDVGLLANNIVSDPCANCVHIQSGVAAFTPPLPGGVEAMQLVRASVDRWLSGVEGYGNSDSFMDGVPSLAMAAWDVIRTSGDLELLRRWLPILEKRIARWKSRDTDANGLFESAYSGNRGDWRGPCNAWDCINFGHEDAYSLSLGYCALRRLADLERLAARPQQAAIYDRDADRIREAFVPTFLNPKTGILAGWKSRDGQLHDYWFTFINGQAIVLGLVPDQRAHQILDRIQAKFKEVGYTRFDLGLPWQLVPVPKDDYHPRATIAQGGSIKEDGSDGFQNFVNGAAHAQSYMFLQALYQLGRREEAEKLLWPMMATHAAGGFQNGIGQGGELTRWDGAPSGYEGFLSHCYRGQLATLTGHYGILFGPEGFRLAPWSPLKGQRVKLGLKSMGRVVEAVQ